MLQVQSTLRYLVYLHTALQIPHQCHDLGLVTLQIDLFNFPCAEVTHITSYKSGKFSFVFLHMSRCQVSQIHEHVHGRFVVAKHAIQVILALEWLNVGQSACLRKESRIEVFNYD